MDTCSSHVVDLDITKITVLLEVRWRHTDLNSQAYYMRHFPFLDKFNMYM